MLGISLTKIKQTISSFVANNNVLEVHIMGKGVMSDKFKYELAHDLGFGAKVEDGDWSDVTTGEVGSMVREAIKRGEAAMAKEAQENGAAHQNAE
ncbi:small acid-soluble spore protein F (minor alpha/beta-type SASP) [Anaerospora hongkongensis]|uniref:Small acid-soluble spore protein F (Minor alpha/beta-type SASP) n=3 Tax=Anaerospora TaxID=244825 RepID=A0A4R1Q0M7_9FIRM|nr:small, acid-soluble spore protein, alpha/beta type [Anaerospora hongkongensis]TCL39231.1 small acid-soluble spore protein F (minor alpha/beta-type SASP) [Anaerospora hongkongensis]